MQAIAYYLSLPFIYFFSLLPLPVLYFISDVLVYPVLYYVVGYRKKVVRTNLERSFPGKSQNELRQIEKKFYRFLSDLFMETVKFFTISKASLQRRFLISDDFTYFEKWFNENKSYVLTLGHYANYEWLALSLDFMGSHQGKGPFRKMSNPYFNDLFLKARSKFGTVLFPTYETMNELKKESPIPFNITLANDQSAPPKRAYWTTFLNQDTSFFIGTEKIAKDMEMPVVFANIERVKRGYYSVSFDLITEFPKQEETGVIMEKHARLLEKQIQKQPEFWLWSHRRWKHQKPKGLEKGFSILKKS